MARDAREARMARDMDSILAGDPTVHDLPESSTSDSQTEQPAEGATAGESAKSETTVAEKQAPADKQAPRSAAPSQEDDEQDDGETPNDLELLKRSLKAARGDKRKARKQWQETERRLAELQGRYETYRQQIERMSQMQAQQPAQQQPKPEQWDLNEENFYSQGPEAVKRYYDHKIAELEERQRIKELNRSERIARQRYADFDQKVESFRRLAPPEIVKRAMEDDDPAEFVYQYVRNYESIGNAQSIDDLRKAWAEEEREKLRAEVRAEMEAQAGNGAQQAPRLPPKSIATARGNGAVASSPWTGPRNFGDIFGS